MPSLHNGRQLSFSYFPFAFCATAPMLVSASKKVVDKEWGGETKRATGRWVIVNVFWCAFTYLFFAAAHSTECRYSARQQ